MQKNFQTNNSSNNNNNSTDMLHRPQNKERRFAFLSLPSVLPATIFASF
jgi:hypothetical protein